MTAPGYQPSIVRLARSLGLRASGDCLPAIRKHALGRVNAMITRWPVRSLSDLQLLVANQLGVCLEYVRSGADIDRIAATHPAFSPHLDRTLRLEFLTGDTEGLLLCHPHPAPGDLSYLAVIDMRGERAIRGYFTVWHELSHLLVSPPQLAFEGFRRSPATEARRKDALEHVVDDVAGLVGFFEPLFGPVLDAECAACDGRMGIAALERVRAAAAPNASFLATALAAIRRSDEAVGFVCATRFRKRAESSSVPPSLRIQSAIWSSRARREGIAIAQNLRVPPTSVLARVEAAQCGDELWADEDQQWWETSARGSLGSLPLKVAAAWRGAVTYAVVHVV